jgi:hypothetical protein
MCYDIIYSVVAHESVETLHDLILNMIRCNKKIKFKIILHLNDFMFEKFKTQNIYEENLIINPIHYNKNTFTHLLLKGHLDNFQHFRKNNIQFRNMMFIASNCMFFREFDHCPDARKLLKHPLSFRGVRINYGGDNLWTDFKKNKKMFNFFVTRGVRIIKCQFEGKLLDFKVLENIYNYIYNYRIFSLIEKETCFEEFILPSLEKYFTGECSEPYCKVYWELQNFSPTIDDINKLTEDPKNFYIVKRVKRDNNCPVRRYIRNYVAMTVD